MMFVRTVRSIRNKFISRRLCGLIEISRKISLVSTAMECEIPKTYYLEHPEAILADEEEDQSQIHPEYLKAISMTDVLLDSLERRAMGWDGTQFNDDVMLTRGATCTFAPIGLGALAGFSINFEISATVESLIDSRKRYERSLLDDQLLSRLH
jgi:hypothetical protein